MFRLRQADVQVLYLRFDRGMPVKVYDWWGDGAYDGDWDIRNIRWFVEKPTGERCAFRTVHEVWSYVNPSNAEIARILETDFEPFMQFLSVLLAIHRPVLPGSCPDGLGLKQYAAYHFHNGQLLFQSWKMVTPSECIIYQESIQFPELELCCAAIDRVQMAAKPDVGEGE